MRAQTAAKSVAISRVKRMVHQWVLSQVLRNIAEYRDGFLLEVDGKTRWLVPVFCMMLTDWPEGQAAVLVRAHATKSKRNCRVCLHPTVEFADTSGGVVYELRKQQEMRDLCMYHQQRIQAKKKGAKVAADRDGLNLSMWWETSAMWSVDCYTGESGLFGQFPFDTLHTIDQGLVKMLRLTLLELVDVAPNTRVELNRRFKRMPMVLDQKQRNLSYRPFWQGITKQKK